MYNKINVFPEEEKNKPQQDKLWTGGGARQENERW
jgi:hypothetical protein